MVPYAHLIATIGIAYFLNFVACGPIADSENPASLVHVHAEGPLLPSPSTFPANYGADFHATTLEEGSKVSVLGLLSQKDNGMTPVQSLTSARGCRQKTTTQRSGSA